MVIGPVTDNKLNQHGFMHLPVLIACLVIVLVFAAGWTVAKRQPSNDGGGATITQPEGARSSAEPVSEVGEGQWVERPGGPGSLWSYEGGTPPECPDPVLNQSPVNTARATDIGLPGQWRGEHYKAHGGIRFDGSKATDIEVRMPLEAKLFNLKRYMENGEVQYLVEFINDCGIKIRFDHIFALSPELDKIAATTPPAGNDTRSVPSPELFGQKFKAGSLVGTAIGHPAQDNIGVDFGVYDLRQQNDISKNARWAELHRDESAHTYYGICWLTLLPKKDAEKLKSLYGTNYSVKYVSDYCTDAPDGATLQHNNGRP